MMLEDTKVNQLVAACIVASAGFGVGTTLAWTATSLPDYEASGAIGDITPKEKSWMAALAAIGALIASAIGGPLIHKLGLKGSLLLNCVEGAGGWLLLVVATRPEYIYVGRFLTGFASGGYCVVVPLFLREISSASNRGAIGSLYLLMICFGKLFSNAIGITSSTSIASLFCLAQPILHGISLLFIPESPEYLLKSNQEVMAREALLWFNKKGFPWRKSCSPKDTEAEIDSRIEQITASTPTKSSISWKTCLTSGEILKPCLTGFLIMALSQLSGNTVMTFYTVAIFEVAGKDFVSPKLATLVIAVLQTIACLPASFFVDKYGRKVLFLTSYGVMAVATGVLAGFFYVRDFRPEVIQNNVGGIQVMPLISMIAFYMAFCWGVGNVSYIAMAELLPPQVAEIGAAIGSVVKWASAMVSTLLFQMFIDVIPIRWWFLWFSSVSIFGAIFTASCLPETKGLTLEEIQAFYATSRRKSRN